MEFQTKTFSRETLQGLAEEHRLAQLHSFINQHITAGVLNNARQGMTSFLFEKSEKFIRNMGHPNVPTDDELLIGLCDKFPGCTITAVEEWADVAQRRADLPPTRVLKRGIKIDWS